MSIFYLYLLKTFHIVYSFYELYQTKPSVNITLAVKLQLC
ncbi:hypothetical protein BRYFOR_08366 [Marvinbryantia formatexigens DSM 14469]|uniref:Uncharacterized protein n=1 Tax=Marvinbryantia formatexigens DSM 14469 TaxID=478749 RepID=C6LI95_9FIRM|nr:hypothetical protein BRYFOR_08366 [Marvinbryantia formatexigens DSM 14469]